MAQPLQMPLNRHQLELLKLFSRDLDEKDLIAIKQLIVQYLGEKISDMADVHWDEQGWSQDDVDRILKSHDRTPYNPQN